MGCKPEPTPLEDGMERLPTLSTDDPFESIDLKNFHDELCSVAVDSIVHWRSSEVPQSQWEDRMYANVLLKHSALYVGVSESVIEYELEALGIDSNNWMTLASLSQVDISTNQYDFLIALDSFMLIQDEFTSQEFHSEFESFQSLYDLAIGEDIVARTSQVALSSYPLWNDNTTFLIVYGDDPDGPAEKDCSDEGADIAFADVFGAVWGSWGGLPGAVMSCAGSSLGASVRMAIKGGC